MSDSEDDWFTKDEEEIVQSLQCQLKHKSKIEEHEERIEYHNSGTESHLKKLNLQASATDTGTGTSSAVRFTTAEMVKLHNLSPLDMFLYIMAENRNFFANQLTATDSQKRVLQYLEILYSLCQLQLAGFYLEMVRAFGKELVLLDQLKRVVLRLFAPSLKGIWDTELQTLLRDMKWLLIRAYKLGVLSEQGHELLDLLKTQLNQCSTEVILKHPLGIELAEELQSLSSVEHEIYPKLEQLFGQNLENKAYPILEQFLDYTLDDNHTDLESAQTNVCNSNYIENQLQLLRQDFTMPLRQFLHHIRNENDRIILEQQGLLWPHTQIMLNPDFTEAQRHSLVFVDIQGPSDNESHRRNLTKLEREFLKRLKTGALLCFSSNTELDNLILATVTYTEPNILKEGFISVEIVKQYNIGNIYGKSLLLFQSPEFFEPYMRVHDCLINLTMENLPMRRYIVDGALETKLPAYATTNSKYTYIGTAFTPNEPTLKLPLNGKQRTAFTAALRTDFCLIQGPPGTGKTHLSSELVKTLLENAKWMKAGPIVVLTYTNDSLDKFLLKASQYTNSIVRFGSQSRLPEIEKFNLRSFVDGVVPPRLKRVYWLVKNEFQLQFEHLQKLYKEFDGSEEAYQQILAEQQKLHMVSEKIDTIRTVFQYYAVRDKALIAMTTSCAARLNYLFRCLETKIMIFEEAGEIQESHVLASLTTDVQHVIMFGDHKQLRPFTARNRVSLFERLIMQGFPLTTLNVQYRMRSCISELLVPTFYDELICDDSVFAYKDVELMGKNLYFVTHEQNEKQLTDFSYVNEYETNHIVNLAKILIKKGENLSNIVILSPYAAQVNLIKRKINVNVQTVDSFQGLEADIILLSLVRSNKSGNIGFLRQPNRVCVALSRARRGLYIIGNMKALKMGNQKLWSAIEQKLLARNLIGEIFPV